MLDRFLENILGRIWKDMANKILEVMPNEMINRYIRYIIRWNKLNAMVGDTRNKIIIYIYI